MTTTDNKSVRDYASNSPYDQIVIIVNTQKYGGGGIFNFYSVSSSDHQLADFLIVHEFGHGFAGLADLFGNLDGTNSAEEAFNYARFWIELFHSFHPTMRDLYPLNDPLSGEFPVT